MTRAHWSDAVTDHSLSESLQRFVDAGIVPSLDGLKRYVNAVRQLEEMRDVYCRMYHRLKKLEEERRERIAEQQSPDEEENVKCPHDRLNDYGDACLDCGAVYLKGQGWQ